MSTMAFSVVLQRASTAALVMLMIAAQPSAASSPDAWDEFRQKVATNCVALAVAGNFRAATARVDPFGTESYGVALVTGTLKQGVGPATAICVMDKKTGKAELSGESKDWVTMPKSRP
jgi:hypothetical protein